MREPRSTQSPLPRPRRTRPPQAEHGGQSARSRSRSARTLARKFLPPPLPLPSFRKDLKYPILYGVAEILEGTISPREGLHLLMEKYPLRLEEIYPF